MSQPDTLAGSGREGKGEAGAWDRAGTEHLDILEAKSRMAWAAGVQPGSPRPRLSPGCGGWPGG